MAPGSAERSALESAEKAVRRHEVMTLGRGDARRFFDAVTDPPPPNDRLRAALDEHRRRVDTC
ncbi:MAG: DUF1778 domain-containing protein [Rhodospirillaceae bacterium]|nr:DUF1778 domain-containing protein [Rhodospirillaceae bacterium]